MMMIIIIIIRSSSHGSTSEMAAAVRYRDPELRPGYSYSDLHSDYHPEEDPEYYCEWHLAILRVSSESFSRSECHLLCRGGGNDSFSQVFLRYFAF